MLRIFQQVALWEAISALILFVVAMPMKYWGGVPEAVSVAGSIHGFLVVVFAILLIACWQSYNWTIQRTLKYLIIGLLPFVSFWVERDLKKLIKSGKTA